jgi:hypothetical protein
MSEPIVYIDRSEIRAGKLDDVFATVRERPRQDSNLRPTA